MCSEALPEQGELLFQALCLHLTVPALCQQARQKTGKGLHDKARQQSAMAVLLQHEIVLTLAGTALALQTGQMLHHSHWLDTG